MMRLKTKKAQTTTSEIVILLFIVVGAVVGMSAYFQRGLQGRIRDANAYIINVAAEAHGKPIPAQYEPYYGHLHSNISREETTTDSLSAGPASGISDKRVRSFVDSSASSFQDPPRAGR